jgi:hypothetical protein
MVNSLFNGWRLEDVWLDKEPTACFQRFPLALGIAAAHAQGPAYGYSHEPLLP